VRTWPLLLVPASLAAWSTAALRTSTPPDSVLSADYVAVCPAESYYFLLDPLFIKYINKNANNISINHYWFFIILI